MKSKLCAGNTLRLTATECAVAARSLPNPFTAKLYACEVPLVAVTVNGAPELVGVMLTGFMVQLGGEPVPQESATALLYPFKAVTVPLNTALTLTWVVRDGFEIANA